MEVLRLKDLIKEKGLIGKDLAEKVGVHPVNFSKIVSGHSFPKPELLKKIAEVLDVDIRELFHKTKDTEELSGFVEYKGHIYRIKNLEDIEDLSQAIRNNPS